MKTKPRKTAYDITLAGIGIGGFQTVTLETIDALKDARVIFDFTESHQKRLEEFGRPTIRIDELYWSGEFDERVYRRLADMVLEEAKRGPRVVYIEDGHPAFYDDVTWDIYRRGRRRGMKVRILPAVSCLDSMIANCALEIGGGFQILEATSVVAFNQTINPHIDLLIMQIGWFGTSLLCEIESNKRGRFQPLIKFLRKYYPANQPVRILRAASNPREKPVMISTKLNKLDLHRNQIATDSCLFIGSVDDDTEANAEFLKATKDKHHLADIATVRTS